jgi:hypothetical protein
MVRTGYRTGQRSAADPGDLTGTPGIVWSVKDCAADDVRIRLDELDTMTSGSADCSRPSVRAVAVRSWCSADPMRARPPYWVVWPGVHRVVACFAPRAPSPRWSRHRTGSGSVSGCSD